MLKYRLPWGQPSFRVILALVAAWGMTSCGGVEYGEYQPYLPAAHEEIYQFDISLLSEWGGAIEPEQKNVTLCFKDNHYFRIADIGYLKYSYNTEDNDDLSTITFKLSSSKQDQDSDSDSGKDDENAVPAPSADELNQLTCRKMSDNNASHYGVQNNCLIDPERFGAEGEELYMCQINFNTINLTDIDKKWHNIFPELSYIDDAFQLSQAHVCIYKDDDALLVRQNVSTPVVSIKNNTSVDISEDAQNVHIQLLRSSDSDNDDNAYYEVNCFADGDSEKQSEMCKFDDEKLYTCKTLIGGATGLNHIWKDVFKRDNVPMYIASNGDNFGITKATSREFNDLPTLQILSALQLNVDTFGNHAFDKDISMLSHVVERSQYPYVVSNLKNVPQNLKGVSPFTIWQVPAQDAECSPKNDETCCRSSLHPDGADCLNVAVVSALESTVKDYVYPGLFGSLEVTDYCDVLYALQEAYNANARAFFVLAHIATESDYRVKESEGDDGKLLFDYADSGGKYILTSDRRVNVFVLLQTLFSLQGYYPDICKENHLIIPEYRIQSKKTFCPAICASDEPNADELCMNQCNQAYDKQGNLDQKALEQQIIREMNKEIFDGIIGIFTASGDEHLVGFTTESLPEDAPEGMVQFRMNGTTLGNTLVDFPAEPYFFDNDYLYTKNLFDEKTEALLFTDPKWASVFDISAASVAQTRFDAIYEKLKSHPLWVMRLPDGGEKTANFRIKVTRNDTGDARSDALSQPYVASLEYAELLPTLHSPDEIEDVKPARCLDHLKKLVSTDAEISASVSHVSDICRRNDEQLSESTATQACSCYHYFNDIQDYANHKLEEMPSYLACADYLQTRANALQTDALAPVELQYLWSCIYKAKTADICNGESAWDMSESENYDFKDRVLFDLSLLDDNSNMFTHYVHNLKENELRSQTSFVGNLVADMMLSTFNLGKTNDRYDVSFINAGALNLLSDVQVTQHTQETLKALSPYENGFLSLELSPSAFVNYITHGIGSSEDNRGQYPLLAGVMMSTVRLNGVNQIVELWAKHQPDEFMPFGCKEENEQCQCQLKQEDGTCLVRMETQLLKEPLYQLVDMVDVTNPAPDATYPTKDSGEIDCEAVFQSYSSFDGIYNNDRSNSMYIFDPRKFHWQGKYRFNGVIAQSSNVYGLKNNYCTEDNNHKLFNVYYNNHGEIENNRFYPMILHVNLETLHSTASPRKVCKCYFTLASTELEPGQTELGFTTDPTEENLKNVMDNPNATEDEISDILDTHNYAEPTKGKLVSKKIRIALVDFIAKGGDNFELPPFVDPADNDGKNSDVMFDAYPPSGTTNDVLGEFFDTGASSMCKQLDKNPNAIDGRRDIDIAWDNAFYHHIDVTHENDKTNVFILEKPNRAAPMPPFGQYIIDGIQQRERVDNE